jgi:hypothetical protein
LLRVSDERPSYRYTSQELDEITVHHLTLPQGSNSGQNITHSVAAVLVFLPLDEAPSAAGDVL